MNTSKVLNKSLVTGGTGLTGSHLLLYLTRKGEYPRATFRHKKQIDKTFQLFKLYSHHPDKLFKQIEWVKADITDLTTLDNIFENIAYVYHTAALISFKKKDKALLHETNVEGTKNLLNIAQSYPVKKFLHVSSVASLGQYENPITEQTHWNWKDKQNPYALTKYLAEMEVWRAGQEDLPVVVINPGVILGAGFWEKGTGQTIKRIQKGLKFYLPGGNSFVDVWDVVKVMYDLTHSSITNEAFIVGAYDLSFRQLFNKIANVLGVQPPKKALPKSLAYGLNLLGLLPKPILQSFYKHPHYSSQKLQSTLNFNFIPFEASISNIIAQYKKYQNA